jgi:hypothetical protein
VYVLVALGAAVLSLWSFFGACLFTLSSSLTSGAVLQSALQSAKYSYFYRDDAQCFTHAITTLVGASTRYIVHA